MFKVSIYQLFFNLHIIFESLPISSSGHISLLNKILYNLGFIKEKIKIPENLEYLMHIPTAFILFSFLWPEYNYLVFDFRANLTNFFDLSLLVFGANFMTANLYFLFKKIDKNRLPLYIGFFITSAALLSLYLLSKQDYLSVDLLKSSIFSIEIYDAFFIGIAQGLALLPGISRLALTYVVGCWLGISPLTSFVFSLTIELPLIIAAVLKALCTIKLRESKLLKLDWLYLFLIILSSYIAYKLLLFSVYLIKNNLFWFFGIYMLLVAFISLTKFNNSSS